MTKSKDQHRRRRRTKFRGLYKFSISLLCHNQLAFTKKCLASVIKYSPAGEYELILVDNASTDGTTEYLEKFARQHAGCLLLRRPNDGFGRAHNDALRQAQGDYFLVLNNDLEVCQGWLEAIHAELLKPNIAQVGLKQNCNAISADGRGCFGKVNEYVECSLMAMPTPLAREVGMFDHAFVGFYCEDADLSLRLRAMGYEISLIDLPITHHRAVSTYKSGERLDFRGYEVRNRHLLQERWSKYMTTKAFTEKYLIERDGAIGDVVWVSVLARELRRRNHAAQVFVRTMQPGLLYNNPNIIDISKAEGVTNPKNYDHYINLNGAYEANPQLPLLESYGLTASLNPYEFRDPCPEIYLLGEEYKMAERAVGVHNIRRGRVAVFHTGRTAWAGRNYPITRWRQVAQALKQKGWYIVEVGAEGTEPMGCAHVSFISRANIRATAAIISVADLFLGIDSSCANIAQAFKIPSVVLFGCVEPATRLANLDIFKGIIAREVNCRGCHQWQAPPRFGTDICLRGLDNPNENDLCMQSIKEGEIIMTAEEAVENKRRKMEASKIRSKAVAYCQGEGLDLGCSDDKINDSAIGVDGRPGYGVNFVHDLNKTLPYKDGYYDYVFSSHTLEHLTNYERALRDWARVLKPGGYLVLYLPHADHYTEYNPEHLHNFRQEDILPIIMAMDFEVLENELDVGPDRYSFFVVGKKRGADQ